MYEGNFNGNLILKSQGAYQPPPTYLSKNIDIQRLPEHMASAKELPWPVEVADEGMHLLHLSKYNQKSTTHALSP